MSASTPHSRKLQDTKKRGFPQLPQVRHVNEFGKNIPFVLGPTGAGSATAPSSVEELVVRFLRLAKPTALVLRPRGASSPTPSSSREHLIRVSGHPHNGDCSYQKQGNTKTHQGIPTGSEG